MKGNDYNTGTKRASCLTVTCKDSIPWSLKLGRDVYAAIRHVYHQHDYLNAANRSAVVAQINYWNSASHIVLRHGECQRAPPASR